MQPEIVVGLLSFAGTLVGTLSGISLIKYRIQQLEKKQDKHNELIERVYKLEGDVKENKDDIIEAKIDIKEIKAKINKL